MPYVDPIPALKRALAAEIVPLLDGWNAHDIAAWMHTDQPRISDLKNGKLERFSLERLIRFAERLDRTIELRVTPRPRGRQRE
jgi:predicted XRE-type DNA-binding protein